MAPTAELEQLQGDFFGLKFAYDPALVSRVRALKNRRWNKEEKRWEVHIGHLADVIKLFQMDSSKVDRKLMRSFQIHSIRNSCVRIEVGNVTSKLQGTNLPLDAIDEVTSFFVPGYQYMPKFQEGQWDGKRHLFDRRTSSFPSGLVARVSEILEKEGIDHEVTSAAEQPTATIKTRAPKLELRDYQKECIRAAVEKRRGVLELATGSGKTAVAACLIHQFGLPALFVVQTRDLLHQTRNYLHEQLGLPIGCIGDGTVDLKPISVATVQTCAKALEVSVARDEDDEPLESDKTNIKARREEIVRFVRSVPVVFFDECHHLPADCCYGLAMQTHGALHRFGLSATPYRTDRMDLLLEAAIGPSIYSANASLLIEKGYLVPPKITFYPVPPVKYVGKIPDYTSIFNDCIVEHAARNKLIVEKARELAARKKSVLVLVSQVRHGEELRKLMKEAVLVQGSDPAEARARIFEALEKKEQLIVIATTLADEGLDIPSLNAVIMAAAGKSETRALQRIGRALRTAPRKKEAIVIDFMDDAPYLSDHSRRRLELFQEEPMFQVSVVEKAPAASGRGRNPVKQGKSPR